MSVYTNKPSAIDELQQELTAANEAVMEEMMMAVLDAAEPQDFDRIVNGNPEFQRVLLKWRGHLTLAARAFYRMQTRSYSAAFDLQLPGADK